MKKIYIVSILFIFSLSLNAQITKNTWLIGSQLTFNTSKSTNETENKQKSGGVQLLAGKALKDNLIAGINFGFNSYKQTGLYNVTPGSYLHEQIMFTYGVFGRQYKNLTKDLYFFGQLDADYITGRGKEGENYMEGIDKSTTRGALIALTPGLSYRIYKKLQFEISLPNLLNFQYTVKNVHPTVTSRKDSKEEAWGIATSFSNTSGTVSYLGAGFHLLL